MVINVFKFRKYFLKWGYPWIDEDNTANEGYIDWNYVPLFNQPEGVPTEDLDKNILSLGMLGYRMGKSHPKLRLYSWVSLLWTPEYNGDGSFLLELPDTIENRDIRLSDQLMYDEDTSGTIMVVTSRQIQDHKIVLSGISLHCYILSQIYSSNELTYYLPSIDSNAQDFIYNILSPFFSLNTLYNPYTAPSYPPLSGWDCVSADSLNHSFAGLPVSFFEETIKWERGESAWEFIKNKILKIGDIGFGSSFIEGKYIFEDRIDPMYGTIKGFTFHPKENASKNGGWQGFYVSKPGLNNTVRFSKARGNVINEIFTESENSYINNVIVFVGENLNKLKYNPILGSGNYTVYVKPYFLNFTNGKELNDSLGNQSVTRRSAFIDASDVEPQGYNEDDGTYSETPYHYIERIKSIANEEFSNNPFTKNWRFTVIDPDNKVKLGDIIPIESEYTGEVVESRVTSITYKSQGGHTTRTLSVGTPIRTKRN